MEQHLSSIRMFASPTATVKIKVPDPTTTHFFTAGRIVSYFPQVNKNGFTFFKDECEPVASTLVASTTDIQHVKEGYGVKDPLVAGQTNTIVGAISEILTHDEGIDILCKIERSVAAAMGFTPDDFIPGKGLLAQYSQECEYSNTDARFIVVDKNDPTKIVKSISYADGSAIGMKISRVEGSAWKYETDADGNPIYMAVKPLSFSGVGHVVKPADPSAITYALAASEGLQIKAFVPGMDSDDSPATDMVKPFMTSDYPGSDMTQYTQDFVTHPDLLSDAGASDKSGPEEESFPDDHYAACWSDLGGKSEPTKDGKGTVTTVSPVKNRLFKIKDKKGEFDRKKLIQAYQSIMGLRGDIHKGASMPMNVRLHALALVRHGLNQTKPKTNKENSSHMDSTPEIEALNARIRELATAQNLTPDKVLAMVDEHKTLGETLASKETLIATLDASNKELKAQIETLTATIQAHTDEKKSTERLAALDKILAFTEDEKKAEAFAEYVKSLASLSDTDFRVESLTRELSAERSKKASTPERVLASFPSTNPVPAFIGGDTLEPTTVADLY